MPRRVPATSPALRNNAIDTSFVAPETAFVTDTFCGSTGRFATRSRSSRNGSVDLHAQRNRLSVSDSPISTSRSASQSPMPLRSSSDMTTSMLVLNWMSRSRGSLTAPSRIPWNSTPYSLLEGLRERQEVLRVHLHRVGMARIADDLIAEARESCHPRPPANSLWSSCRSRAIGRRSAGSQSSIVLSTATTWS